MNPGDWVWNEEHKQLCQIVQTQTLWGETLCRVWLPVQGTIVNIAASRLKPLTMALTHKPKYHLRTICIGEQIQSK